MLTKCQQGCGELVLLYCWQECRMVQPFWKTVWQILIKLNIYLSYDSAVPLLGICTTEMKVKFHEQLFMAILIVIAKGWKQSGVLQWVNDKNNNLYKSVAQSIQWSIIHDTRNKLLMHVTPQLNIKDILNETSLSHKVAFCVIPFN